MKVLPIGKGYVTLYFFAIMIHCSPPFCYESGIMQHYAYVHPMWFLCFSAGGLPAGVNIIWLLEVSCGFLYSFLFVLNWGCSARPRLTDIRDSLIFARDMIIWLCTFILKGMVPFSVLSWVLLYGLLSSITTISLDFEEENWGRLIKERN